MTRSQADSVWYETWLKNKATRSRGGRRVRESGEEEENKRPGKRLKYKPLGEEWGTTGGAKSSPKKEELPLEALRRSKQNSLKNFLLPQLSEEEPLSLAGVKQDSKRLKLSEKIAPFDGVRKEDIATGSPGVVQGEERRDCDREVLTKAWRQLDIRQSFIKTTTPSKVEKSNCTKHPTLKDNMFDVQALPVLTEDNAGPWDDKPLSDEKTTNLILMRGINVCCV